MLATMHTPFRHPAPRKPQSGAALIVAMLLLAVMLTLGSGAMESTLIEQKGRAQLHDASRAFENAESAATEALYVLRQMTAKGVKQPEVALGYYLMGVNSSITKKVVNPRFSNTMTSSYWVWADLSKNTLSTQSLDSSSNYVIERIEDSQEGEPASPTNYFLNYSRITTSNSGQLNDTKRLVQGYYVEPPK